MIEHGISFDPEYLFEDVQNTVYNVHQSGEIHRIIARDLGERSKAKRTIQIHVHCIVHGS